MDEKLAYRMGIQLGQQDTIRVKVANGQEIISPGQSQGHKVKLQGYSFSIYFFLLPLAGCDIVLGIQWLCTPGPILRDFIKLTMSFSHGGQRCLLQGMVSLINLDLVEGEYFKLSKTERKGVIIQLLSATTTPLSLGGGSFTA